MINPKALVEAALFVSDKPLTIDRLSAITSISQNDLKIILEEIETELRANDRGIELVETPEGFELRIKPIYRDRVARLAPLSDLSDGMLRTLAIVAAKQPVKQSLIVKYQGNKTYGYIVKLEEKGLIKTEKYGRTRLVNTSPDFEKYFGKSAEEIKRMLVQKS